MLNGIATYSNGAAVGFTVRYAWEDVIDSIKTENADNIKIISEKWDKWGL